MTERFIKFKPSQHFWDLVNSRPTALALLCKIVARARRKTNPVNGLQPGEALIGFTDSPSRRIYRTDLILLKSTNQITTKTTNRGTIAKLKNTTIFDINIEAVGQPNDNPRGHQEAIKRPLTNNVKNNKYISRDKSLDKGASYKKTVFDVKPYLSYWTTKFGNNLVNVGKNSSAVKKMLSAGYSQEQIFSAVDQMANDSFWNDKGFDYANVSNQLPKLNMKKTQQTKGGLYDIPRG